MPVLVGKPVGEPTPVADDEPEDKTPWRKGDPPRLAGQSDAEWHGMQDRWVRETIQTEMGLSVPDLPNAGAAGRHERWQQTKQLYYTVNLRKSLTGSGQAEYERGTRVNHLLPLSDELLTLEGMSGPAALEGDDEYADGGTQSRGYFAKRVAEQHHKIFHELIGGAGDADASYEDAQVCDLARVSPLLLPALAFSHLLPMPSYEDAQLAAAACKLTPAAVLEALFGNTKRVQHANELILPRDELPEKSTATAANEQLPDGAETNVNVGVEVAAALGRTESLPDDRLDLLAKHLADVIQGVVEERCKANMTQGIVGGASLEALPEHFTYEDLLGANLLRCGRSLMAHNTVEELHTDGTHVLLFFGQANSMPSAKFARRLKAVVNRITRAGGKSTGRSCEVVYIAMNDSKIEYDRFTLREAGGWWAMPHSASGSLGERARRKFAADGVPTCVVTKFDEGRVKLINPNAVDDIYKDDRGDQFPWPVKSIDEMLGPVLIDKSKKTYNRSKVLRNCSVLAIYFGGEWCPHCINFKPTVDKAYAALKAAYKDEWELVYVSSDQDAKAFERYFGSMAWYAVPFEKKAQKEELDRHFKVTGIPTVVILKRNEGGVFTLIEGGQDGRTILSKAPAQLKEDFKSWGGVSAGAGPAVGQLTRALDKLEQSITLLIACEHLPPSSPQYTRLEELLEGVAEAWEKELQREPTKWPKLHFLIAPGPVSEATRWFRSEAKLPAVMGTPADLEVVLVENVSANAKVFSMREYCTLEKLPFGFDELCEHRGRLLNQFLHHFTCLTKPPPPAYLQPPIACDYGMAVAAESHQAAVALDNAADPSTLRDAPAAPRDDKRLAEKLASKTETKEVADQRNAPRQLAQFYRRQHDARATALGVSRAALNSLPAPAVRAPSAEPTTVRVLQWNVLAEGLSDDGFLVSDATGDVDAPALSPLVEEVMAARKSNTMSSLKERFSTSAAARNHAAIVDWTRRRARLLEYMAASAPDVLALQEIDHMAELQVELGKLGYSCGFTGKAYQPAHAWAGRMPDKKASAGLPNGGFNRDTTRFVEHLEEVGIAFMPKTQSNCRSLSLGYGRTTADDDGVAIFWRTETFELSKLDFLVFDDTKRHQGAVRATLRRRADGRPLAVIATHLTSGSKPEEEHARLKELTAPSLGRTGAKDAMSLLDWISSSAQPMVVCLDTNSAPDFPMAPAGDANVYRTLRGVGGMRGAWDAFYTAAGEPHRGYRAVTTNKMRGPLSAQPKKMGEHTYGCVDAIFYRGNGFELLQHAWGPLECAPLPSTLGDMWHALL